MDKLPAKKRRQCGTVAGYRQHHKRGEAQCAACREANRVDSAERRARRSAEGMKCKPRRVREVVEVPSQGGAADGGYPVFLGKAGRQLWDSLNASFELDPVSEVVAVEVCRLKDRLDRCAGALSSSSTLWFELGEPEELMSGEVQVQVVVNNLLGESRQMANALSQLMKKLEVLAPARRRGGDVDPLAALAAEAEAFANGR